MDEKGYVSAYIFQTEHTPPQATTIHHHHHPLDGDKLLPMSSGSMNLFLTFYDFVLSCFVCQF